MADKSGPRIGVAGWSIPRAQVPVFGTVGSHLERYARLINAVEINSSFYRPHRVATYARWAAAVPDDFRFAVKLPKAITHARRLVDCDGLIAEFAGQVAGLGSKRGPTLVQLPPSLAFDAEIAATFFAVLGAHLPDGTVCEPRHASWFEPPADALLQRSAVARVAADPARGPAGQEPGGWSGLAYFRLHGAPEVYRSAYAPAAIAAHARRVSSLAATGTPTWTIYDNTAAGAAIGNALELAELSR